MQVFSEHRIASLLKELESLLRKEKSLKEDSQLRLLSQIHAMVSSDWASAYNFCSLETLLKIPEIALLISAKGASSEVFASPLKIAEAHLKQFMGTDKSEGLFHIKSKILWARLLAQKANHQELSSESKMLLVREAIEHLLQAQAVVARESNNKKYAFVTYNISQVIYQIVKNYFRQGFLSEFTKLVQIISADLSKSRQGDENWNLFFSWLYVYCVKDLNAGAAKQEQYEAELNRLWNSPGIRSFTFYEEICRLKVTMLKDKAEVSKFQKQFKENEPCFTITMLQAIKSGKIEDNQIENELKVLLENLLPSNFDEKKLQANSKRFELLAEIARVAAHFGVKKIAQVVIEFLKKIKSLSPRAILLTEYTKAELLMSAKTENQQSAPTSVGGQPSKNYEINKRKDALHILQKALKTKIKYDPLLMYEGCVLIWNIALPFLNENYVGDLIKPFQLAARLLEDIESNDYDLRIRFHYEIVRLNLEQKLAKSTLVDKQTLRTLQEHVHKCREFFNYSEKCFDRDKIFNLVDKVEELTMISNTSEKSFLVEMEQNLKDVLNEKIDDVEAVFGHVSNHIYAIYKEITGKDFLSTPIVIENSSGLNFLNKSDIDNVGKTFDVDKKISKEETKAVE